MPSLMLKFMACVIGLAIVLAAAVPADAAKARKHKKVVRVQTSAHVQGKYWGTNLFPAGPIYHGNEYLGDDPDPFIRMMILRDLGAHYGDGD